MQMYWLNSVVLLPQSMCTPLVSSHHMVFQPSEAGLSKSSAKHQIESQQLSFILVWVKKFQCLQSSSFILSNSQILYFLFFCFKSSFVNFLFKTQWEMNGGKTDSQHPAPELLIFCNIKYNHSVSKMQRPYFTELSAFPLPAGGPLVGPKAVRC